MTAPETHETELHTKLLDEYRTRSLGYTVLVGLNNFADRIAEVMVAQTETELLFKKENKDE